MPRSEGAMLSRKPILFRFPHSALSVLMKLYSSAGNYPSDICPAFWVQDRGREIVNLIFSCCLLFRKERVVMDEKLTGLLQPKEKKKLLQDHCKIINILIKKKKTDLFCLALCKCTRLSSGYKFPKEKLHDPFWSLQNYKWFGEHLLDSFLGCFFLLMSEQCILFPFCAF